MIDWIKRLWPFVTKRYHAEAVAERDAAIGGLFDLRTLAEAERDAADENAARGWRAADELAEKLQAAQDAAAEADRRARKASKRADEYWARLSRARRVVMGLNP